MIVKKETKNHCYCMIYERICNLRKIQYHTFSEGLNKFNLEYLLPSASHFQRFIVLFYNQAARLQLFKSRLGLLPFKRGGTRRVCFLQVSGEQERKWSIWHFDYRHHMNYAKVAFLFCISCVQILPEIRHYSFHKKCTPT